MQNIPASVEDSHFPLSDIRNPSHIKATKLYKDYLKSEGKYGLDPKRYYRNYKKQIKTDHPSFNWRIYKLIHPNDVVVYDDNEDEMYNIYTDEIDKAIFSPVLNK
jgi:hypothetical protein